jgi:hypothetical protein
VNTGSVASGVYFSLSTTFRFFQCSIVVNQPVNARKDPNVADREQYSRECRGSDTMGHGQTDARVSMVRDVVS